MSSTMIIFISIDLLYLVIFYLLYINRQQKKMNDQLIVNLVMIYKLTEIDGKQIESLKKEIEELKNKNHEK